MLILTVCTQRMRRVYFNESFRLEADRFRQFGVARDLSRNVLSGFLRRTAERLRAVDGEAFAHFRLLRNGGDLAVQTGHVWGWRASRRHQCLPDGVLISRHAGF